MAQNPLTVLYSYGFLMATALKLYFSSNEAGALNTWFLVFAIAHIRGGEDLGRHWYEDGKMLESEILYLTSLLRLNILSERNTLSLTSLCHGR